MSQCSIQVSAIKLYINSTGECMLSNNQNNVSNPQPIFSDKQFVSSLKFPLVFEQLLFSSNAHELIWQ